MNKMQEMTIVYDGWDWVEYAGVQVMCPPATYWRGKGPSQSQKDHLEDRLLEIGITRAELPLFIQIEKFDPMKMNRRTMSIVLSVLRQLPKDRIHRLIARAKSGQRASA